MRRHHGTPSPPWIILALFVLLVAGVGLSGYFYFAHQRKGIETDAQTSLSAIARLKVDQIVAWRGHLVHAASALRENPFLAEPLRRVLLDRADPESLEALRAWGRAALRAEQYQAIVLVDADGKTRLTVGDDGDGPAPQEIALALQSMRRGQIFLSDLDRDAAADTVHLPIAVPVPAASPGFPAPGALLIRVDPRAYLYPLVQSWPTSSPSAETLLVRAEGKEVLFLNELRHVKNTALRMRRSTDDLTLPAARAVRGIEGVTEGVDYRGIRVLAATRAIPGSPWSLVAKVDVEEVYAPIRESARNVSLAVITLILLSWAGVAFAVQRQRLAFYRRHREEAIERQALVVHYDQLTRHVNDIMLLMDGDGKVLEANERASEAYGYSREEMAGLDLRDLRHPESLSRLDGQMDEARSPRGVRFETLHRRKDGSFFPVEVSSRLIEVGGKPFFQSVIRDVSERKRAEELILRLNRLYAFLSRINESIIRTRDRQGLLEEVCRIAVEIGSFRMAWVGFVNNQTGTVEPAAHHGAEDGYLARIRVSARDVEQGRGPTGSAVRERRTVVCNDVLTDPRMQPWRAEALKRGYRASAAVPLPVLGKIEGTLNLYAQDPSFFDEEEIRLLDRVGANLGFALEAIDREEQRRRVEQELAGSEGRFRTVFESANDAILILDGDVLVDCNRKAEAMFGLARQDLLGQRPYDLSPPRQGDGRDSKERALEVIEAALQGAPQLFEWRHLRRDGRPFDVEVGLTPLDIEGRRRILAIVRDMSDRRQLEDQLRQSQKMEAVGRLAGGVAHDFNNLLTAILGHCELALAELGPDDPRRRNVGEIRRSADRAAGLTRQLLTFSRRQILEPCTLDLNRVVSEMAPMLRRLIGEDVTLVTRPGSNLAPVKADPGQVEQVLMNLVVNGRDAMPDGGELIIETGNAELDEEYARANSDARPGPHVMLAVTDSGCGMPDEVRSHLFEPFFTTKGESGTGLGLSTVYGIVRQSGGSIAVQSEPGRGTTVRIFLPRWLRAEEPAEPPPPVATPRGGNETVLVAEDEATLLSLFSEILESRGYRVLRACGGEEALAVFERHGRPIDLLLTDVVMPRMGGRDLAKRLAALQPGLRVVFMSGYAADELVHPEAAEQGIVVVQKPFTPGTLVAKVREVLDSRPG